MKHLAAIFLAAAASGSLAVTEDDLIIGHFQAGDNVTELSIVQGACPAHQRLAFRFESLTKRSPYVFGCWQPAGDRVILMFPDGTTSLEKARLVRHQRAPNVSRFSL